MDEHVPLRDAEIAAGIAAAARKGRPADRRPAVDHLLAAFGEPQDTPQARRRIAAALAVADIEVRPPLEAVEPGARVELVVGGAGAGAGRRAAVGAGALVVVLAGAAVASTLAGGLDGGDPVGDALPAGSVPTVATTVAVPTGTTTLPTTTAQPTTPATTAQTTPRTTTTTARTTETTAAERARDRARRRAAERRAAARRRLVTVRLDASVRPTFLCAEDGNGRVLYNGTLTGFRTFRAREVRLNIGLASTVVRVNGRPVALTGSPAGLLLRRGVVQPLALGERPDCG